MPVVYVLRNDRPEGRYTHGVRYRPDQIPESDRSSFAALPDPPDARPNDEPAAAPKAKAKKSEEVK
jgi:hypothetical protein